MVRLTEILRPECIRVPLRSADKRGVVLELVDLLADCHGIAEREQLKEAVWARETDRSTGIGYGIAIPHGRSPSCPKLALAVGLTSQPIEYASMDGKPVQLVLLLCSPLDQAVQHIQALARITRCLTDARFRGAIKAAPTADEVYRLISEQEAREADVA